jgi:hypothetical protein
MGTGDAILKTEFWLKITQVAWATNRTGIHYDAFHPGWHAYGIESLSSDLHNLKRTKWG